MSARIMKIVLSLLLAVAASAQAQTVEYLHTDALGSVVAVTNTSRTVLERREYEPYGSQLTPAVTSGPGYTGHVQDAATGLVYMQQRYYDAQIGRFLSVDPIAVREKGDNYNRYAYALDNPYRFTDPAGTEAECVVRNNCANVVLTEGQVKVAGAVGVGAGVLVATKSPSAAVAAVRAVVRALSGGRSRSSEQSETAAQAQQAAKEKPGDLNLEVGRSGRIDPRELSTTRQTLEGARLRSQREALQNGDKVRNIQVDKTGRILDGNHRARAAAEAGQDVTADVVDDLSAQPGPNRVQDLPVIGE
jgi:RHS repeat-associated protein